MNAESEFLCASVVWCRDLDVYQFAVGEINHRGKETRRKAG